MRVDLEQQQPLRYVTTTVTKHLRMDYLNAAQKQQESEDESVTRVTLAVTNVLFHLAVQISPTCATVLQDLRSMENGMSPFSDLYKIHGKPTEKIKSKNQSVVALAAASTSMSLRADRAIHLRCPGLRSAL